jgi:uncharacterized membrane protein YdjX (TVP38/TMEM64 family)/rhodanese-related sulfurtransferase
MTKSLLRVLVLGLVLAGIAVVVSYRDSLDTAALEQWVAGFGDAGPVVFMLLYALGTVLFLPGSVITLAGGAMFGPLWGTVYNLTGATLGALLAFLIARYLAADWVERRVGGRMARLKQGVEAEGWRFVAFVRLVPLFPFNALNFALGLTRIRLSHYVIASYVCMLPGAFAYTYLGYVGREAIGGGEGLMQKGLLALALLAVVSFLPGLIARLRQGPMLSVDELQAQLTGNAAPLLLDLRTPEEFAGELGHVAGALNMPLDQLSARVAELGDDPERPIALICLTDKRSATAARLLARQGFANLQVVKDGMTAWHARGYAVVRQVQH